MLKSVSTAAILAATLTAAPVMAQCGSYSLQTSQDKIGQDTIELAQSRDGSTLREQENRRSGGDGTAAPASTVKPQGGTGSDSKSDSRGTFTSPSTTGNPNTASPGSDSGQSGGDGDSGGSGSGGGSGGSGGGSGGGGSGGSGG